MTENEIVNKMFRELLNHHGRVSIKLKNPFELEPVGALLTYGELYKRADLGRFPVNAGKYLHSIAVHCKKQGWPPLNALVVNSTTHMPGEGFKKAPGTSHKELMAGHIGEIERWTKEVLRVLQCEAYAAGHITTE